MKLFILEKIKNIAKNVINVAENIGNFVVNLINNTLKLINNTVILIFLTAIATSAVTFFVNVPIEYDTNLMTESRDYVVNKRSLKVHIGSCYSVTKMSEKNKLLVNNSLENLLTDGYYICNRCKGNH